MLIRAAADNLLTRQGPHSDLAKIKNVTFGTIAEWLMLKIGLETKIRLTRDSQK